MTKGELLRLKGNSPITIDYQVAIEQREAALRRIPKDHATISRLAKYRQGSRADERQLKNASSHRRQTVDVPETPIVW